MTTKMQKLNAKATTKAKTKANAGDLPIDYAQGQNDRR
jgi:hypothetical protein